MSADEIIRLALTIRDLGYGPCVVEDGVEFFGELQWAILAGEAGTPVPDRFDVEAVREALR